MVALVTVLPVPGGPCISYNWERNAFWQASIWYILRSGRLGAEKLVGMLVMIGYGYILGVWPKRV